MEKIIKFRHKITGKIKYLRKPTTYPIEIGKEVMFSRFANADDKWIVVDVKIAGREVKK